MSDKILGGKSENGNLSDKVIAGQGDSKTIAQVVEVANNEDIYYTTKRGGLETLPQNFDEKDGSWQTILSDNPFEVLFLDYEQYLSITPEMVARNYKILSDFWSSKNRLLIQGGREQIKRKFGNEDTVENSLKKLQTAYEQLKSAENIEIYYKEVNEKRIAKGIHAISKIIEISLADGRLTKHEANTIIENGRENNLKEDEVRIYLLNKIREKEFKPRATKKNADEFDNLWMTDEEWKNAQQRTTSIFGNSVSTLEEIGEVLFNTKEDANKFIQKYLPTEIVKLASSDKAMEFESLIEGEKESNRRFLKVVYHLNPSLPFRIDNNTYQSIKQLFEETANDYELLLKAALLFEKKYIQIWLLETDPSNAAKLPKTFAYNDYLKFVYKINNGHPFFISKNEKFGTPKELTDSINSNSSLWVKVSELMLNNQLFIWLSEIGKENWVKLYNERSESVIDSKFHSDEDKKFAAIQTLIQIIDPTIKSPSISSNLSEIELLTIEGSHTFQNTVIIKLKKTGFVKARVYLDNDIPGVGITEKEIKFFSQGGQIEQKVTLNIESLKLIKDKEYTSNIKIETLYETITIPIKLKAVFPKKAYLNMLLKYAGICGVIFGLFRFMVGLMTNQDSWLSEDSHLKDYLYLNSDASEMPANYFLFFVCLVIFLVLIFRSFFIIKKVEKL